MTRRLLKILCSNERNGIIITGNKYTISYFSDVCAVGKFINEVFLQPTEVKTMACEIVAMKKSSNLVFSWLGIATKEKDMIRALKPRNVILMNGYLRVERTNELLF